MLQIAALLAAVVCAFSNSLDGGWVFDDRPVIQNSPEIRDWWHCLATLGTSTRSLVRLTFATNYAVGGLSTTGYHLVNLVVHFLAAVFLYAWLRLVLKPTINLAPFFIALLFALHPLTVQSVTYVTQRYSSMSGMFFFGALAAWARYRDTNRYRWCALAFMAAIGGMLSKEMAVAIPLALLAADFSIHAPQRRGRKDGIIYLLMIPLLLIVPLLNYYGTRDANASLLDSLNWAPRTTITRSAYFLSQLGIIVFIYLRLMLVPLGLSVDHPYEVVDSLTGGPTIIALLALLAGFGASIWAAFFSKPRLLRLTGLGGLLFFLGLGATSTLVPNPEFVQEQRAYVSLAGIMIAVVGLAYQYVSSASIRAAALSLIAVALAVLTFGRNEVWQSDLALWGDALKKNPDSSRSHVNYGAAIAEAGKRDEAMEHYEAAIKADPTHFLPHYNLGVSLGLKGRVSEAMSEYRRAIELEPDDYRSYYNLANALREQGRCTEAVPLYRDAARLAPLVYQSRFNMALCLEELGQRAEAAQAYRDVLALQPQHKRAKEALARIEAK